MSESEKLLTMRRSLSVPAPDLGPLPDGFSVHTDDGRCAGAWEWIIRAAFEDPDFSYSLVRDDPLCAPERVFFVKEYSQDIGTVAVDLDGDTATLRLAGVHPVATGRGAVRYAIAAAIEYARGQGAKVMTLKTEAFRLPAIRIFLAMGFDPVTDGEGEKERWAAVMEALKSYRKKEWKVLPLWPEGEIPYWEEGQCVPSVTCYPIEGSRGAVVVCPGGGYGMKASHEGAHIARMINEGGVSAFVLDYRVRPCYYEAPLTDALRAVRAVRAMGYEKVSILGFSAGGHLACSAATLYTAGDPGAADPLERLSSRPDSLVACYPVVSFCAPYRHVGSTYLLGDKKDDEELLRRFSAELHINGDTPPACIWHTSSDDGVPVENSLSLASAYARAGVPFELHVFPEGEHGLGLAGGDPSVGQWGGLLQRWLLCQGYGAAKA